MPNLLASDLFASATGLPNSGSEECHWCGAKCLPQWRHDDPGRVPYIKFRLPALRPQSLYICTGCRMYRRTSFTVRFLNESFRDRQTGSTHSWYMTDRGVWAIRRDSCQDLLDVLLEPPLRFCLSLTDGSVPNYLQLMKVNDLTRIEADTPLTFTLNNVPFTYTVYELEDATRLKIVDGKEAGVRELFKFLRPCLPPTPVAPIRGRGEKEDRPNAKEILKKPIAVMSGSRK